MITDPHVFQKGDKAIYYKEDPELSVFYSIGAVVEIVDYNTSSGCYKCINKNGFVQHVEQMSLRPVGKDGDEEIVPIPDSATYEDLVEANLINNGLVFLGDLSPVCDLSHGDIVWYCGEEHRQEIVPVSYYSSSGKETAFVRIDALGIPRSVYDKVFGAKKKEPDNTSMDARMAFEKAFNMGAAHMAERMMNAKDLSHQKKLYKKATGKKWSKAKSGTTSHLTDADLDVMMETLALIRSGKPL